MYFPSNQLNEDPFMDLKYDNSIFTNIHKNTKNNIKNNNNNNNNRNDNNSNDNDNNTINNSNISNNKNNSIMCCSQKIDICVMQYFKYVFFVSLFLTNICNIILNYKILSK